MATAGLSSSTQSSAPNNNFSLLQNELSQDTTSTTACATLAHDILEKGFADSDGTILARRVVIVLTLTVFLGLVVLFGFCPAVAAPLIVVALLVTLVIGTIVFLAKEKQQNYAKAFALELLTEGEGLKAATTYELPAAAKKIQDSTDAACLCPLFTTKTAIKEQVQQVLSSFLRANAHSSDATLTTST